MMHLDGFNCWRGTGVISGEDNEQIMNKFQKPHFADHMMDVCKKAFQPVNSFSFFFFFFFVFVLKERKTDKKVTS